MVEINNDRDIKRTRILEAALKAYMDYGIGSSTIRQIAEIAGIGKSTVYEYFQSSDQLVDEAFAHFISILNEGWKNIHQVAQDNPSLALSMYLDTTIELIINEPDKLLLVSQYITSILEKHRNFEEVRKEYGEKVYPMVYSLLEEYKFIITRGIEKEVFKPAFDMDEDEMALMLMALIREMQSYVFMQDKKKSRDTCQRVKIMVFHMLGVQLVH